MRKQPDSPCYGGLGWLDAREFGIQIAERAWQRSQSHTLPEGGVLHGYVGAANTDRRARVGTTTKVHAGCFELYPSRADVARLDEIVCPVDGEGQLADAPADQVLRWIVSDHERTVRFAAPYVGARGKRGELYFDTGMRAGQGRDGRQRDLPDDGGYGYDDTPGESLVAAGDGTTKISDMFGDRLDALQGIAARVRYLQATRISVEQLDIELAFELVQPAGNRRRVYVQRLGSATYCSRPGKCPERPQIVPMEVWHDLNGTKKP